MYTLFMLVSMWNTSASLQSVVIPNLDYQQCVQTAKQTATESIKVENFQCVLQSEKK